MDRRHTIPLKMVDSRSEKVTELANWNEKGHDPTGNREVLTVREMSVEVKRVFNMPITKISNRRLPQAETTKGGLAPLVACVSPAGWCEKDVGGGGLDIQLPTVHEVATNSDCARGVGQGKKFICITRGARRIWGLRCLVAALCRRKTTEDSSEIVCKVGRRLDIDAGRGTQSLSNKRDTTNMHGGHERSQWCVLVRDLI